VLLPKRRPIADPIAEILGEGGLLSARLPSYEARRPQLVLARAVLETLDRGGRLVAEAGTGTGKTLAYLVPAVLSGLKVVISTGTKTLQEQLRDKDIPLVRDLLETELEVACMKGLSNYLCLRRLGELRRTPGLFPDAERAALERWASLTETGDRAELAELPDGSPLWAAVCSSPETRLGPRCPRFEDCFVTRMRRDAGSARLLVVNHHLLFADLALRSAFPSAAVIPAYEALILDEAHGLETIATSFFGRSVSSAALVALGRELERAALFARDAPTQRLARQLLETSGELFHVLAEELPSLIRAEPEEEAPRRGPVRAEGGRLRLAREPLIGPLEQPYFALDAALEALAEHLALAAQGREDWVAFSARCQRARDELGLFAEPAERGSIFWVERGRSSLSLHASPVEVGSILERTLLAEPVPIVFTSATLATPAPAATAAPAAPRGEARPAELAYFCARVGLEADRLAGRVEELVLPSPFDFERQLLLYLPLDLPQAADPGFILAASERISQLCDITHGRALVLFTSYRHLEAAHRHLRAHLDYPLLCQGEAPRSLLLDRFRREVSSVLLATASFWEGVDVVGESLSLLIMDKLPFAVPGDPLVAARIELLRERGEDPFVAYQLPQAALTLKQGFGRLLRHRHDRGIVAVLDRRLQERRYGRQLLACLPPCPRTTDLLRVRRYACETLGNPLR
jgi:ATP-dependent DNA helicase DinG